MYYHNALSPRIQRTSGASPQTPQRGPNCSRSRHTSGLVWRLPCVLLSIRTTLKPDLGASPADLLYGEQLAVPGETLPNNPVEDETLSRQRASALAAVRVEVARLQPVPTSAHRKPLVHIPQELDKCSHIFVRRGGVQSTLSSPYVGPFRVVRRDDTNFVIAVPGRANETVSISRVKPCFASADEAEDAEPASPPPVGRPPRPPNNPPPPRRNRRRRTRQIESDDEHVEEPQPPPPPPQPEDAPHSSCTPPPNWRPPSWFKTDPIPDDEAAVESPTSPPSSLPSNRVMSDDEFFGDADPAPTPPPMPNRPPMEWFSPEVSPNPTPTVSPPKPAAPRQRLFSKPQPGHFSYMPPAARQVEKEPPQPEASQRPRNEPILRTFSRNLGRFSRRKPDVNALRSILTDHLGLNRDPPAAPASPDLDSHGFFPPLVLDKKRARPGTELETFHCQSESFPHDHRR